MNRTKIEWTEYTWNPITGCLGPAGNGVRCSYCMAHSLAKGRLKKRYLQHRSPFTGDPDDPFAPRWWINELTVPVRILKPSKIFVCSMSDFCGPWVPHRFRDTIRDIIRQCPQHTFQILTKHPEGLKYVTWPRNCWVGCTATNEKTAMEAVAILQLVRARVVFLSLEPLLGHIPDLDLRLIDWLIIGLRTNPLTEVPIEWLSDILDAAQGYQTPVFLKNSFKPLLLSSSKPTIPIYDQKILPAYTTDGKIRQEWPNE